MPTVGDIFLRGLTEMVRDPRFGAHLAAEESRLEKISKARAEEYDPEKLKLRRHRYEAWLLRHKSTVAARIKRLNPYPPPEGVRPLGLHYTSSSVRLFERDAIGPQRFIKDHGIAAYRALPKRAWKRCGLKKYMSRADYLDNVWKLA